MSTPDRKDPNAPERDAGLRQAWHQASDEQPPSRLDATILAAAHEAVRGGVAPAQAAHRRSRSWLARWQPVAAAAAVTGLAFVLVQMLPRDRGVAPSTQVEAPAAAAESPVRHRPPAGNSTGDPFVEAEPVLGTNTERNTGAVPEPAAVPSAAVGRPSASPATRNEAVADRAAVTSAAEPDSRDASGQGVSAETAPAAAPTRASAAKQSIASTSSAADWAARVAALHDAGNTAQAADALRAFRAVYPDADGYLPESLRAWAGTIE